MFLSFSSSSELYRVSDGNLQPMGFDADGTEAYSALNPSRRRGRRRAPAELPDEVAKALARVPSGYKVGYDADGNARLVRKRVRRRK
ncbi:MAG: hypothetical protein HY248_01225, partial [Fimbriimonas ginsengisoli]|nr:hypothetical protein [Fimbriimonas ginsengisoli]